MSISAASIYYLLRWIGAVLSLAKPIPRSKALTAAGIGVSHSLDFAYIFDVCWPSPTFIDSICFQLTGRRILGTKVAVYKKWIRLSLRTALLITTVACFVLGHRAYVHTRQRDALQKIHKLGGQIQCDATRSSMIQTFVGSDNTVQARDVTSVAFLGAEFDDSDIGEFSQSALMLPRLETVMMTDTMVTTDGERLLQKKLPNLEIRVINLIDQQKSTVTY